MSFVRETCQTPPHDLEAMGPKIWVPSPKDKKECCPIDKPENLAELITRANAATTGDENETSAAFVVGIDDSKHPKAIVVYRPRYDHDLWYDPRNENSGPDEEKPGFVGFAHPYDIDAVAGALLISRPRGVLVGIHVGDSKKLSIDYTDTAWVSLFNLGCELYHKVGYRYGLAVVVNDTGSWVRSGCLTTEITE